MRAPRHQRWLAAIAATALLGLADARAEPWSEPRIPGTSDDAVTLGRDLDGDGDADEISIRLEIIEVAEEVYPGEFVTFWVFAPEGRGMTPVARAPSPTIRVEQGDRVRITLKNTHYFPHTIHLHGTIHPNVMDGVPDITQPAVKPGESFTYEFIARNPGTHFYHCHVQPDVHVLMGLAGMLIIEPDRPDNHFSHLVVGAGRIPDPAKATREAGYDREYSLVYMDMDDRLNRIPAAVADPREIEKRMHREYDPTRRTPNIFLLNGRSFPFTLRDTPIEVAAGERVKLRILNAGSRPIKLHTHGHHPVLTHRDGYAVPDGMRYARDVFDIGAAQRIDLELRPGNDDVYASGKGVWIMHDHTEKTVTNKGISPGGDLTAIVYEGFMGDDGLPKVATSLKRFFDPAYYRGAVPVFDPAIFHTTREDYDYGWEEAETGVELPDYPVREQVASVPPESVLDSHRAVAKSCAEPRGFRRVVIKGGVRFAAEGEVFAFEPREIRAGRCEEIEVVFENADAVRHALMIPGLSPMFMLEFAGPGTRVARFVTPDADVTLAFHCHVETHEKMGMHGVLIVGKGSGEAKAHVAAVDTPDKALYEGVGVVVAVDARLNRLVLDHGEIKGLMGPMVMGFPVTEAALLRGLAPGDRVRFTIDADKRAIVGVTPLGE